MGLSELAGGWKQGACRRDLLSCLLVLLGLIGCGEVQLSAEHRELILRLATATSNRDSGQLEAAALASESAFASGRMNESEWKALASIVEAARAGRWEEARQRAYALRDGQVPSKEDLERVEKRVLPEMRTLSPRERVSTRAPS